MYCSWTEDCVFVNMLRRVLCVRQTENAEQQFESCLSYKVGQESKVTYWPHTQRTTFFFSLDIFSFYPVCPVCSYGLLPDSNKWLIDWLIDWLTTKCFGCQILGKKQLIITNHKKQHNHWQPASQYSLSITYYYRYPTTATQGWKTSVFWKFF